MFRQQRCPCSVGHARYEYYNRAIKLPGLGRWTPRVTAREGTGNGITAVTEHAGTGYAGNAVRAPNGKTVRRQRRQRRYWTDGEAAFFFTTGNYVRPPPLPSPAQRYAGAAGTTRVRLRARARVCVCANGRTFFFPLLVCIQIPILTH